MDIDFISDGIKVTSSKRLCAICGNEVKDSEGYFYKIVGKDEKYICPHCNDSLNAVTPVE